MLHNLKVARFFQGTSVFVIWIMPWWLVLIILWMNTKHTYTHYKGGRAACEAERSRLYAAWAALSEQEQRGKEGRQIMQGFAALNRRITYSSRPQRDEP
jgi:hypothetical protein